MRFYIVHAFTEKLFGGNPAGVVILEKDQDFPDSELCLKIAAELRYSETVFIKPYESRPNHFYFRYFTPIEEVPLCGHATIGAFTALNEEGLADTSGDYTIETLSGVLDIKMEDGFIRMAMGTPKVLGPAFTEDQIDEIYKIMGTDSQGEKLKPQIISTGLPDIMLPLCSQKKLNGLSPDFNALAKISEIYNVTGVHAFTLEGEDATAHTRNFAPLFDIDEEAATGTASGALTFYLYKHKVIENHTRCVFIQGEAMNRPSTIITNIHDSNLESDYNGLADSDEPKAEGQIKIDVGGTAIVLASGKINIFQ